MLTKMVFAASAAVAVATSPMPERMRGWKKVGAAQKDAQKTFSVAMPMGDFAGLEKALNEVSDPYSPKYGQWLSKQQADAYTATPKKIVDEVYDWATSTGARCVKRTESLKCAGSVAQVESLLDAELATYVHTETGNTVVRTTAEGPGSVPESLKGKVLMVTGLSQFPVKRLGALRPIEVYRAQATDYAVVPETLQMFYNVTTGDSAAASSQGPIEFQGYPAIIQSDLTQFAANVALPNWTIPAANTIGPFAPGAGAESALDEQYIYAMGPSNTQWYWTEADWLFEFGTDISNTPDGSLPQVMSLSYAWYELDQCDISPGVAPCQGTGNVTETSKVFVAAVNALFAKAGSRGISMLSASGDSGAHGRTDPGCTDPVTRPDFPAASPFVTAVGATEISDGTTSTAFKAPICASQLQCANGGTEVVASNKLLAFFSSGGGFSTVTPRPSWQDAVVKAYLASSAMLPPAGDFNATNRGFPDVAALGHNYYIQLGGSVSSVDGTSAATPVFAGLVGSLNAWRIANGKPVLGYLNPLLYAAYAANPLSFNDITSGDNSCTEGACPCPANTGFGATAGWDATTGLGTPNYGVLKATIEAMGI